MQCAKVVLVFALFVSHTAVAGVPNLMGGWSGQGTSILPDGSMATSEISLCIERQEGGLFSGSAISFNTYFPGEPAQVQPVCGTGYIATDKRVTASFTPPVGSVEIPAMALFDGKWTGNRLSGVVRDPSDGATSEIWLSPDPEVICPLPFPGIDPFITEIHYDNEGIDSGEAIEVTGPTGTDLSGYSLLLYNGNGGAIYGTVALGGEGVVVVYFPTNGLQNGSPDGIALVDGEGNVLEFLSYEGSFIATDGAAIGMVSTDIGVAESSATQIGESLQLIGGVWTGPSTNTFGILNDEGLFTFSCLGVDD